MSQQIIPSISIGIVMQWPYIINYSGSFFFNLIVSTRVVETIILNKLNTINFYYAYFIKTKDEIKKEENKSFIIKSWCVK